MPRLSSNAGQQSNRCMMNVIAHGAIASSLSNISALRKTTPPSAPSLPKRFLNHADEQTVMGIHAILNALVSLPEIPSLEHHGIIAASCQAGRIAAAQTLVKAQHGGGVTVSTQIVPQCSLHSIAGAISVGLKMHGPNIGVSGGSSALSEGLLTACTWLLPSGEIACDTTWVVITGWDDEPTLDETGLPTTDPMCRSVAIGLTRSNNRSQEREGLCLEFDPCFSNSHVSPGSDLSLQQLGDALSQCSLTGNDSPWIHRFPWGGTVRILSRESTSYREAA